MAIFDIDEIINDPWAGLRDTEAYVDYVLEEAQRLLDCGELEENPVRTCTIYLGILHITWLFGLLVSSKVLLSISCFP